MKKVLAIALLCAVSSFATWDKFPVQDAGKGEAKVGFGYWINPEGADKTSILGATLGARYSIIQGLEASLQIPFPLSASAPGFDSSDPEKSASCKAEGDFKCPPSYGPPVIGVRYWLPLGLGVGLDIALPLQGDAFPVGGMKDDAKNNSHLDIIPAVQYSTNLTSELSIGAEVSLTIPGKVKDVDVDLLTGKTVETDVKPGMDLGIGVELDYAIGSITPYVGVDIALGLTKAKFGDIEAKEAAKTGIDLGLGAIYKINDSMGADIGVTLGFGGRYETETIDMTTFKTETKSVMPITIQAHYSYYF